jgi:hypothetical protein
MKKISSTLMPIAIVLLGPLLGSGCYTQLALNDDEPDGIDEPQPVVVVAPPPVVIVPPPILVGPLPDPSPVIPVPVIGTSSSFTVSQAPSGSDRRDIGNHRPGSGRSDAAGSGSGRRDTGSARGGR